MEGADEKLQTNLLLTERNLARQYWQRWRKEERSRMVSKKRSRRGVLIDPKTTSMEPPKTVEREAAKGATDVGGATTTPEEVLLQQVDALLGLHQ